MDEIIKELAADRERERHQRIANVSEAAVAQWERTIRIALNASEREQLLALLRAKASEKATDY